MKKYMERFLLNGRVIVVTGAAGLLGIMHVKAILEAGGIPILIDINQAKLDEVIANLKKEYPENQIYGYVGDITDREDIEKIKEDILEKVGHVDGLINNACNNPQMKGCKKGVGRFETFSREEWNQDLDVGLYGAVCCSQVFGEIMAEQGNGVILNIASDLGIIAPNQNLYRNEALSEEEQPKKPVTYSATKWGLIGVTKYLSTYWAEKNVRANAVAFGGVFNFQNVEFLKRIKELIPLGRMASKDEYIGSIIYMLSDASSYMTGSVVIVDGGRTAW